LTQHFLNFCPGENIAENSQKAHEVAKTDGVRQHSHTKWRQEICQKLHKTQNPIDIAPTMAAAIAHIMTTFPSSDRHEITPTNRQTPLLLVATA
jgi:hypothetical protein